LLAVALNEPAKAWLVEATKDSDLLAPSVLPFEIGNALSALVKRKVLRAEQAESVWDDLAGVQVELVEFDVRAGLALAVRHGIYAYDGYFLQCALESRCPILTLDQGMRRVAVNLGIEVVEQ
jgi:predicted nucleic acid-binding protein